ncbi:MAG: OstA-like protein [Vicingaceae bacterium]
MFFCIKLSYSQTSKVKIVNADVLEFDEKLGKGAKRLIGNVQFQHENMNMFCDSAYFFANSNSLKAFNHVRIVQGDSLSLTGDSLVYYGTTKKALLRGNIFLKTKNITLQTNYLDYDRMNNVAYFYNGGKIVNPKENNTLSSKKGYFYPNSKQLFFKDSVRLINPQYKVQTDTLEYNTATEIVYFHGPTCISNETGNIKTEKGWFNTITENSQYLKNNQISADDKLIIADSIFYSKKEGFGSLHYNISITDTAQDLCLKGEKAFIFDTKDSVLVTNKALLLQYFEEDTLYMHADTFKISKWYNDTLSFDSTVDNKILTAFHHVKFYKKDMQGMCDSVVYNFVDSTVRFYNQPVIWSDKNQLTGEHIYIQNANDMPYRLYILNNAFIAEEIDSTLNRFNQIKGKNIIGYFRNDTIYRMDVVDNAQTIYYGKDDKGKLVGVNKALCNKMKILIENNEISSITFLDQPQSMFYPVPQFPKEEMFLKGFQWLFKFKPLQPTDVFLWK